MITSKTRVGVITISETQTRQQGQRYYIMGELHRLIEGATQLETTWYLEPAPSQNYPLKLNTSGRAELGVNTRLAF